MPSSGITTAVLTLAILLLLARPAHAFGAGNIASVAKIEGSNWRHGDIEDTLLALVMSRAAGGKKFDKLNVSRVYFGNWLRDYSQAIDVGTVKYVSAEAIRILLWVLGFMTFGYGTKEFEVTADRLGCYRPEDHIDNPKDYADNIDATQYDSRLRGPVDERVELAIDPNTGLKNYIANEEAGIMTSALHVRKLFKKSIQLGRSYARNRNEADLHEALRLLGTGLHCLEDFSAHSNYTELALIELGEEDVFPHVGSRTKLRVQGARQSIYPLITGTFGGVDFLHSVMGEFNDKATQSEIQELEGTMEKGGRADTSLLKELLDKIPDGLLGGQDQAGKADELQENATAAQMSQVRVSPREPEEFTRQMQEVCAQIYPIIEWHDEVMKDITEAIEKIPVLPEIIEQLEEQLNVFIFSLLAPFVLPIITQIKSELNTGSSEIIQSSKEKQLIVFNDDECSDPTHSMLSKDHFSNILNEPAGKIASQVLKWVVPQLIQCWDDDNADVDRTLNRIIHGVFHHPALRSQGDDGSEEGRRLMFEVVEQWWSSKDRREKDELRGKLSRDGVKNGENHKEGVEDTGHGCCKPLGMAKSSGGANKTAAGALMGGLGAALGNVSSGGGGGGFSGSSGGFGKSSGGFGGKSNSAIENFASEAAGGGALGGIMGALAGGVGGSLLSSFGGDSDSRNDDNGSSQNYGGGSQNYGGGSQNYGGGGYGQPQQQERFEEPRRQQREERQERFEEPRHQQYGGGPGGYGGGERRGGSPGGFGREERRGGSPGGYGREERRGGSPGGYGGEERRGGGGYGGEEHRGGGGGGFGGGFGGEERRGGGGGYGGEERRGGGGFGGDEERRGGGGGGFGGGFGGEERGGRGGYGEERREDDGERREEYGERRERREEGGGGWFS